MVEVMEYRWAHAQAALEGEGPFALRSRACCFGFLDHWLCRIHSFGLPAERHNEIGHPPMGVAVAGNALGLQEMVQDTWSFGCLSLAP